MAVRKKKVEKNKAPTIDELISESNSLRISNDNPERLKEILDYIQAFEYGAGQNENKNFCGVVLKRYIKPLFRCGCKLSSQGIEYPINAFLYTDIQNRPYYISGIGEGYLIRYTDTGEFRKLHISYQHKF